jgi:hypothetical protein
MKFSESGWMKVGGEKIGLQRFEQASNRIATG